MSYVIGTCAHILIDGHDFSADHHTLGVNYGSEMQDCTTFGQGTRVYRGGLKTASVSGEAYLNLASSGIEAVLFGNIDNVAGKLATVFVDGIETGSTYKTGTGLLSVQSQFNTGAQVGTLIPLSVQLDAAGTAVKATVLENFLSTALSTGANNGGAVGYVHCSTGEKLYAGWHVTAVSTGLASSVSAVIQAASSSGFASSNTRISFSALDNKGSAVATPVASSALSTDQPWLRAVITVSTGSSTGAVANGLIWAGIQ